MGTKPEKSHFLVGRSKMRGAESSEEQKEERAQNRASVIPLYSDDFASLCPKVAHLHLPHIWPSHFDPFFA